MKPQLYGVKCNVKTAHKFLRLGALCWVLNHNKGNGSVRCEVLGLTRGGRRVRVWVNSMDLKNFRAAWVPQSVLDQPYYGMSKQEAEELAVDLEAEFGSKPIRLHELNLRS